MAIVLIPSGQLGRPYMKLCWSIRPDVASDIYSRALDFFARNFYLLKTDGGEGLVGRFPEQVRFIVIFFIFLGKMAC